MYRKIYSLIVIMCCWLPVGFAQETSLRLSNRELKLSTDFNTITTINAPQQFYLALNSSYNKEALEKVGIHLQRRIQQNIFLALISNKLDESSLNRVGVIAFAEIDSKDKLNSLLLNNSINENVDGLLVELEKKWTATQAKDFLLAKGYRLKPQQLWSSQNIWTIYAEEIDIDLLTKDVEVLSVAPNIMPVGLNNAARGITNSNIAQLPQSLGGFGLQGEGVTIGVGDNSDPDHVDFVDRVLRFNPIMPLSNARHAFHTTGTVGGNGIVDERFKGFANKSRLVSDYYSQIVGNAPVYFQDFDMRVTNNSYGFVLGNCSYSGTYDIYSNYLDQQVRDIPTMLHVLASANDGGMTCSPYPAHFATLTASFASAKNGLTIGAMGKRVSWLDGDTWSSRGPAKDGRIKPELITVGMQLISCNLDNTYIADNGTSMAAPNAAGAVGLLYQRYKQLHANQYPSAALTKAMMITAATDYGTFGPDYRSGYGIMNTGRTLKLMDAQRYYIDTINTGQNKTVNITVPPNTTLLKVSLVWTDPAAAPNSAIALINDLDLSLLTPGGATVLPYILDTTPANVGLPATMGVDRLNNAEQIIIPNPTAGNYTIKVTGFNVPEINQEFAVAYDFVAEGVQLNTPLAAEKIASGDSTIVYWEASIGTNTFTLSYSINNGASWTVIDNNIPADWRDYTWNVPSSIASNQCRMRIARNSTTQQHESGNFTITGRNAVTLNANNEQCPGSIAFNWTPVTGATGYTVYRKIGSDMVAIANTNATTQQYTITGLHPDSTYWIAVAPQINTAIGMRSVAVKYTPNTGNCNGSMVHGDLRLSKFVNLNNGRLYTSTALFNTTPLRIIVSNLDNQIANHYSIAYKINNNAWVTQTYTDVISAIGNRQFTLGLLDFSAVGTYNITVAVKNLASPDPVNANDTLYATIEQIDNPIMNIGGDGFVELFETNNEVTLIGTYKIGIPELKKWDFSSTKDKGRFRTFINTGIAIQGQKSASLDNGRNQVFDIPGSSYNTLTGTFNLSNYNAGVDEVRCEFDYIMHGIPKFDTGNVAWIRGSDVDPWLPLQVYHIDTTALGIVYHTGSISVSDILNNNGQSFSSSTQIKFTQYDTSQIAAMDFGNGFTMDNFKLYTVTNDIQLLSLDSIYHYNCGLNGNTPLTIQVANGVNNTVYGIDLYYQLDNGTIFTGYIDSILGKDTVRYIFAQTMDLSSFTDYSLSVWLYHPLDTYRLNDSLLERSIRNQPIITTFPYLQNFETNDGSFYTGGRNSSWAYGDIKSPKINHAASGLKAWKTNLTGSYNGNEFSYLYSPCFDISNMTLPMLSFHIAYDIENRSDEGDLFDRAFVEYSNNGGATWQRLGSDATPYWYDSDSFNVWAHTNKTYWHVVSVPLPKDAPIVSFRLVFYSDQGASFEGVAVDDIHVYDRVHPIFDEQEFTPAITQQINANQNVDYIQNNAIGASIFNNVAALGNTLVQDYKHTTITNPDSTQYLLPKNFVIQSQQNPSDSVKVRLYITEHAMQALRVDNTCPSCNPVREVQALGMTQYADADESKENNLLADNLLDNYSFITKAKLTWVPYDNGYYTEVYLKSFGEIWFNDGGATHNLPAATKAFTFNATHVGNKNALLSWSTLLDTAVAYYELQRANAQMEYITINQQQALGVAQTVYNYTDTPTLSSASAYYRVQYTLHDGSIRWSVIRRLDWSDKDPFVQIYPNPVRNGIVTLDWIKGSEEPIDWAMYNIAGQRLLQGRNETDVYSGRSIFDFNQMGVNAGVYILKVIIGKKDWSFKIVFQQ
jgi:hypothetical protein